jgi:tetratricopeptide (TPR) repeat protein
VELGSHGFDHAAEVYAALRKEKPDFTMDEAALENWGRELVAEKHQTEAIDLFKLNLQLHPDADSAYLWLADTYMEAGQKQSAIETDEALLKKNPDNAEAKEKLKKWKDANSTAK